MLASFSRVKVRCSWIMKSVEHALIFMALFPGCEHGVGERASLLRGAVSKEWYTVKVGFVEYWNVIVYTKFIFRDSFLTYIAVLSYRCFIISNNRFFDRPQKNLCPQDSYRVPRSGFLEKKPLPPPFFFTISFRLQTIWNGLTREVTEIPVIHIPTGESKAWEENTIPMLVMWKGGFGKIYRW